MTFVRMFWVELKFSKVAFEHLSLVYVFLSGGLGERERAFVEVVHYLGWALGHRLTLFSVLCVYFLMVETDCPSSFSCCHAFITIVDSIPR